MAFVTAKRWRKSSRAAALLAAFGLLVPPAVSGETTCADDAILVFDASGSMASVGYNELENPRILDALNAVRRVLPQVTPYRKMGLIVYGPGPQEDCANIDLKVAPQANAAQTIISELERLRPDGNTPLTNAVAKAAKTLDYRKKPAVIVLVTDGDETCGGSPCTLAASFRASGANVTVHVIGFKIRGRFFRWNSQSRGSRPVTSASRCLADMTGGQFVSTETAEELVAALQKTLGCPFLSQSTKAAE